MLVVVADAHEPICPKTLNMRFATACSYSSLRLMVTVSTRRPIGRVERWWQWYHLMPQHRAFTQRFSVQSNVSSQRTCIGSKNLTGDECYDRALNALEKAKEYKEEEEKNKSAQQYVAWQKAKARSKQQPSLSEGVAVVKTIVRQARRDQKLPNDSNLEDLRQTAQHWMEAAAFEHGHGKALVRLGNDALEEANAIAENTKVFDQEKVDCLVRKAMDLYETAGENGAAEGWFNLGHLLWTGYPSFEATDDHDGKDDFTPVIDPDRTASLDSFRKAITLGDQDAMYFVGVQLLSIDDDDESHAKATFLEGLDLVERAAELKHGGALYYLALLHRNGNRVLGISPCSPGEFVRRLDQAAAAGDDDALFLRGHCSCHGEDGYKQDYKRALSDFVIAAEAGNADAAISAGAMLHQGGHDGIEQNQTKAFELYQLAGELGSKEGWRNVVACYALGEGVPQCQQTAEYIAKTTLSEK